MDYNELYHWGIKGQRWGIRRYQNADGSLTDEGREHYGYDSKRQRGHLVQVIRSKHQAKVEAKRKKKKAAENAKRLEAARKAKAEKKAHEEEKAKALKTGSAADILKFKDELTTQEKNEAYNRLNSENNLARLADEDRRRASEEAAKNSKWNKALNIAEKTGRSLETISGAMEKTKKAYNAAAKIINAFSDEDLPIIGESKKIPSKVEKLAKEYVKGYDDMSAKEKAEAYAKLEELNAFEQYASGQSGKAPSWYKLGPNRETSETEKLAKEYVKGYNNMSTKEKAEAYAKLEELKAFEQYAAGQSGRAPSRYNLGSDVNNSASDALSEFSNGTITMNELKERLEDIDIANSKKGGKGNNK